jgi:hypothetical protein
MKIRSGNDDNIFFAQAIQGADSRLGTETSSPLTFYTNGLDRMSITSGGNVGINTTAPSAKLKIKGEGGTTGLTFQTTDSSNNETFYIFDGGRAGIQYYPFTIGIPSSTTAAAGGLLQVGTSALFVKQSDGNVGIGITNPSSKLHVAGGDIMISSTVAAGAPIGGLIFKQTNSTGFDVAQIQTIAGATVVEGILTMSTKDSGGTMLERMRIASDGNVGIGTTSPANKLEVDGGSSPVTLRVSTTDTGAGVSSLVLSNSSKVAFNDGVRISHGGGYTNITDLSGTSIMVWDMSNARVGIGTNNPATPLQVNGIVRVNASSGNGYQIYDGATERMHMYHNSSINGIEINTGATSNAEFQLYVNGGAGILRINSAGNVGIGTTAPTQKLDVVGNATFAGNVGVAGKTPAFGLSLAQGTGAGNKIAWTDAAPNFAASIYANSSTDKLTFATKNASNVETIALEIDTLQNATFAGNVGIGTNIPDAKLDVDGDIRLSSSGRLEGRTFPYNTTVGSGADATTTYVDAGSTNTYRSRITLAGGSATDPNTIKLETTSIERMRITSDGNVGIGVTTPSAPLHIIKDLGTGVTAVARLRNSNSTARTTRLQFEDYNGTIADGLLDFVIPTAGSSTGARLDIGVDSAIVSIVKGGNVGIGTNTPAVALDVIGAIRSSTGILFGTDTAAVNTLDDYEEGTFTATITGGTFTSLNTGVYTKIGRLVYWYLSPVTTEITGNLEISGLPFTCADRSPSIFATIPPSGVTYIPAFHNSSAASCDINVSGTYSGVALSTYFAGVYSV